jgi:hypothetical protein
MRVGHWGGVVWGGVSLLGILWTGFIPAEILALARFSEVMMTLGLRWRLISHSGEIRVR